MIVRSIIKNPNQSFDYFNDYHDTHNWLNVMLRAPNSDTAEILTALSILEEGEKKWFRERELKHLMALNEIEINREVYKRINE